VTDELATSQASDGPLFTVACVYNNQEIVERFLLDTERPQRTHGRLQACVLPLPPLHLKALELIDDGIPQDVQPCGTQAFPERHGPNRVWQLA